MDLVVELHDVASGLEIEFPQRYAQALLDVIRRLRFQVEIWPHDDVERIARTHAFVSIGQPECPRGTSKQGQSRVETVLVSQMQGILPFTAVGGSGLRIAGIETRIGVDGRIVDVLAFDE